MELLNEIWNFVIPVGGGLTIGALVGAFVISLGKSMLTKVTAKLNIEEIENKAVEKGVEKIQTISVKQNIEPFVKSEFVKLTEANDEKIEERMDELSEKYDKILNVIENLANFFDSSVVISDTKKAVLHEAIKSAKSEETVNIITIQKETEKTEEPAKEEVKTDSAIR